MTPDSGPAMEPTPSTKPLPAQSSATAPMPDQSDAHQTDPAKPDPKAVRLAAWLVGAVAAGALVLGIATHSGPVGDHLTQAQIQQRAADFIAAGTLTLAPVAVADVGKAAASLHLAPDQAAALADDVKAGRIRLQWLWLFDDQQEDGDVATVQAGPVFVTVPLHTAPTAVAVPAGVPVTVTGTVDGQGGGVTVGVVTDAGRVPLPYLAPGQAVTVPVQ